MNKENVKNVIILKNLPSNLIDEAIMVVKDKKKVKNFDEEVWNREKINVVKIANMAKFSQNPKLKKYLLGTGSKILVKTNGYESIWGIGLAKDDNDIYNPLKWKGENLLGFILMDIIEILS